MRRNWREHAEAHEELRAAAHRYADADAALGERFVQAVAAAVESLLDPGFRWGRYRDHVSDPQVYTRSVTGFPFDVIYTLVDDDVFVLAYAHEWRRPEYWVDRLVR